MLECSNNTLFYIVAASLVTDCQQHTV